MNFNRIYAEVFTFSRCYDTNTASRKMAYIVEYVFAYGAARSGKVCVIVDTLMNDEKLMDDLKTGLATELMRRYAPEIFSERNIIF